MSGGTIAKYEDGTRSLSLDTLAGIARATGRDLEWFLQRAGYLRSASPRPDVSPHEAVEVLREFIKDLSHMEALREELARAQDELQELRQKLTETRDNSR